MKDIILIIPKYDMSRIMANLIEEPEKISTNLQVYPFMGVGFLADILEKNNISTGILDITAEKLGINDAVERIFIDSPSIIGIYVSSFALNYTFKLIKLIKLRSDIPVLIGGPHVTGDPNSLLSLGANYALSGEAMHTLPRLVHSLLDNNQDLHKIPNLYINNSGTIQYPEAVIEYSPLELYDKYRLDMMPSDSYYSPFSIHKTASIIFSFGCPFKCIFCMTPGKIRYRSVDTLMNELEYLKGLGVKYVQFQDDTFTLNPDKVKNLCARMVEKQIGLKWNCTTRADLVNKELLDIMKKSGCNLVYIGIESQNTSHRNNILRKALSDEDIIKGINLIKNAAMKTAAFIMVGLPPEEDPDIREIKKYIDFVDPDYIDYYIAVAIPGTQLFKLSVNEGRIASDIWDKVIKYNNVLPIYYSQPQEVEKFRNIQKKILMWFYFRPKTIFKIIKTASFKDILHCAKSAVILLKYLFKQFV